MAYTTINKSTDYFNTLLYTGNGSYGHSITGVGFQPDFIWIKNRSTTHSHRLTDAVRGTDKSVSSDSSGAELSSVNLVGSFDSDGFTVDDDGALNGNGNNIVSWNWKANGAGSTNSDGATSSTVSANTTAGFSIVKYTGTGSQTTVGHGLGVVPDVMIIRKLSSTEDWSVYHSANGVGKYQALNTTEASSSNNNRFNVAPTSSVFTVNTHHSVNKSGDNHIAYCFAGKTGYSKFGSYVGNGASSPNEPFVYMGFKPAMVIYKRASDGTNNWSIFDNKRDPDNEIEKQLNPNLNGAEGTSGRGDFVSNGWKVGGGNSGSVNNSGSTYIYMAFAAEPLVGTNNIPATAR